MLKSSIRTPFSCCMAMILTTLACSIAMAESQDNNQLKNLANVPVKQRNPVPLTRTWPAAVGEAQVCTWKDDKLAAVSITIDDNTKPDHAWWMEQGEKYGYRFTWFAVTSGIGNPKAGFNGTWEDFQKLVDAGHDVQSHAATHRSRKMNLPVDEDYAQAIEHLQANLKGTKPLTLAYPGGGLPNDPAVAAQMYAGARGTRGTLNGPSPDYLDIHSTSGSQSFDVPAGQKGDWGSLKAALEPGGDKLPSRGWYCVHYHGVHYNDKWRESVEPHVIRLLDYLKEHDQQLWVGLFREMILYGQQRDTATLKTISSDSDRIVLSLTDRMFDDWYDMPLTVKVRVPESWKAIDAMQSNTKMSATLIDHEGISYALVQVVPDHGDVVLTSAAQ